MKPFSMIAKRVLVAGSLMLVTACGSNGITDPTAARKSGYITVSAATVKTTVTTTAPVLTTTTVAAPTGQLPTVTTSGYNVPAN